MSDQGFNVGQVLFEQREQAQLRHVPFIARELGAEAAFATVPQQQLMRVTRLVACNPGESAGTVSLWVASVGTAKIAQLVEYPVPSKGAVDLTDLIGGLYTAGSVVSAAGTAGVVLSGHYEALL